MEKQPITPHQSSSPKRPWLRKSGPHLELDWLRDGVVAEEIPQWFIDFFVSTRDVGAVHPGQTDNCTMTTVEDNWCLYRLVQLVRPSKSLEIGIMRGSSSITIGKALLDAGIQCEQVAVDIDARAVEAAKKHFVNYNLGSRYFPVVADSRDFVRRDPGGWDFVFLDGDHHYDTVAIELAETFNRTRPGGIIVLHDTGSAIWGTNEDPGTLFFGAVDDELGESAKMTWLDSTSCSVDMKLRTSLGFHSTLPVISAGIAVGYGGLGIIQKADDHKIASVDRLMSHKPAKRPTYIIPPPPPSPLRRAASRAARLLGI
jgi:SAM-dependent methyltransferase